MPTCATLLFKVVLTKYNFQHTPPKIVFSWKLQDLNFLMICNFRVCNPVVKYTKIFDNVDNVKNDNIFYHYQTMIFKEL